MKGHACLLIFGLIILAMMSGCETVDKNDLDSPYDLTIERVSDGQIRLEWNYNSTYDDLLFIIGRKEGESEWNEVYDITQDNSEEYIDEIDTGSNVVYSYKVRAYYTEDSSYSEFSQQVGWFSSATNPTNLSITQETEASLLLTWEDNAIGEIGYKIDKRIEGSWNNAYAMLAPNTTTFTDSVELASEVAYRIYAYSGSSRTAYLEDSVLPSFPAPTNLEATQYSQEQIGLIWNVNSEQQSGFLVERKLGTGDYEQIGTTVDSTWVDFVGVPAASLEYRVRAYADSTDSEGQLYSAYSDAVTILFNISQEGSLLTATGGRDICVYNGYAFIACEYNGIQVVNVQNESHPVLEGTISLSGRCMSVYARDDMLYTTNYNGGLHVYDISDITSPIHVSYCETIDIPYDVEVTEIDDEPYAFIADGQANLVVIALSDDNPANPMIIQQLNTQGISYGIKIDQENLYLADGAEGVKKIDISDPANPQITDIITGIGEARSIVFFADRLLVASGQNGLTELSRASLSLVDRIDTIGFAMSCAYSAGYAYVADGTNGMVILDVTEPSGTYVVATIDTDTIAKSVFIANNFAYLTCNESLEIIQVRP